MENTAKIKDMVLEWIEVNKHLKEMRKSSKVINEKKKQLENNIIGLMSDYNIDKLSLSSGGTLKKNISKKKKNMSKEDIKTHIYEMLNNDELSSKLIEKLAEPKEIVEKEYLSYK